MKMKRFEHNIRKELIKGSLITIFLMMMLAVVLLGVYRVNMRNHRLNNTTQTFAQVVPETLSTIDQKFYRTNTDLIEQYISGAGSIETSQIYRLFYSFNSQKQIKSDLLLFDNNFDVRLSTNNAFDDNYAFHNYLYIVTENEKIDGFQNLVRVFRANNGDTYLIYLHPFLEDNEPLGYGVSVINGKELLPIGQDVLASYVIYDNYSNVLSSNTDQVYRHTGKLEQDIFVKEGAQAGVLFNDYKLFDNLTVRAFLSNEPQMTVLVSSVVLLIVATIFIVLFSVYFSRRVSARTGQSLYFLNSEMERVKSIPGYLIKIKTEDEFEHLADDINNMVEELRTSHANYVKLNQLSIDMEKKKLEAQFHPHFLANTLETIRSAMYIDTELANEVLLRMNSLLRYSVDEQNEGTTLSEDLEYVKNYLAINEIRFEDFSYELLVDKKLNNIIVPKLFLLPLIENSLKYGFKYRRDLKVKVTAKLTDETVIIRVIDNGHALEDKDREKVTKLLGQTEETSYHHGLKNTKQRIQLVYPNAEFNLFSKMSCTVNEIRIKGGKYV
ncbi:sensor histidine kinase [Alkalibacterium pelagium]|uniref:Histidine kinase n=1 Tax=Alkalibacterium pelagium TaxID=426702 RepID=A0A1H7HSE2_9LACT|nr:histidine kinase [Alkalibacterium pelagium]GEN50360.1 histidine kinase [Alkalibacterium pelagium]SEK53088.1 Histidine kinase [Alkalibacterium pelagium]